MRERMDFSSISKIILDNRKVNGFSQTEYYYKLFAYAFQQENIKIGMPDAADVSKILKGYRNVAKDIIYLYQESGKRVMLQKAVKMILLDLVDPEFVKEKIYQLLWNDNSISENKRRELSGDNKTADELITNCLLFALVRGFVPRNKKDVIREKDDFILSDFLLDGRLPSINKVFYGREQELAEIHELLQQRKRLFLEGIGGIGKSELAKQYIVRYQKSYKHVIYLRYTKSLRRTITELDFVDDIIDMTDEQRFRYHFRFFKQLGSNSLVLVDNFNSLLEEDPLIYEFLSGDFKVLITTRSHIEDEECYQVKEIREMNALREFFYVYAPKAEYRAEIIDGIIDEVYRHTLTVELAAKTLAASSLEAEKLLNILRADGLNIANPNAVILKKDNQVQKERLYRHIQALFQIQQMDREQIHTLQNMVLMPDQGISKILFHQWQCSDDFNLVNTLIEYGWIGEDKNNNKIYLHPFLKEVLVNETRPSISSCADILKGIFEVCIRYGMDVPYFNDVLNTIESIFQSIILDDMESAGLFMDAAMAYMSKYEHVEAIEKILSLMKKGGVSEENRRYFALYHCYSGYAKYIKGNYPAAEADYEKALEALGPLNSIYAELASNLHYNLGQVYFAVHNWQAFKEHTEKAMEIRVAYQLPISHDAIVQGIGFAQVLATEGKREEARKKLFALIRITRTISDMGMTRYRLYYTLACIEGNRWIEESCNHFKKARAALLEANIPADSPQMQDVDEQIRRTSILVKGLADGHMKRIATKREKMQP